MRSAMLALLSLIGFTIVGVPSRINAADKPNIVFMMADDQGWGGLSVAMHPDVPESRGDVFHTPHLERLASQGMRFSAAYAPAPVCSPTRISLQTGKSPAALHWTKAAPAETGRELLEPRLIKHIPDNELTIGELLRRAGYATAHYGKWHINGGGPARHGYDESDGDTGNEQAFQFKDPNPVDIFGMAERAEQFMAKCSKAGRPFYVQMSWNALHASGNARTATLDKYSQKLGDRDSKQTTTAAITEDLDEGVGRVLAAIDRLKLADNTFVIYTSDNGSGGGRKALRGGKGDVYEGGIRVPLIVRGPGVAADSWCHMQVVGYDFLPTFCEWAGISRSALPPGVEGGSIAPLLKNKGQGTVRRPRDELVFHFPHYQGDSPHSAIYRGSLKLIYFYEDERTELFDLSRDIAERRDVSVERPAETRQLLDRLQKYLTAVDAQLPTPNPGFDPNTPVEPGKRGGANNPNKPNKPKKPNKPNKAANP